MMEILMFQNQFVSVRQRDKSPLMRSHCEKADGMGIWGIILPFEARFISRRVLSRLPYGAMSKDRGFSSLLYQVQPPRLENIFIKTRLNKRYDLKQSNHEGYAENAENTITSALFEAALGRDALGGAALGGAALGRDALGEGGLGGGARTGRTKRSRRTTDRGTSWDRIERDDGWIIHGFNFETTKIP
jgi:hypothetical protein